jgi:hypothetical protein
MTDSEVKALWGKKRPISFIINSNGCFLCTSHRNMKGRGPYSYPQVKIKGKQRNLSRVIYEMIYGPIPPGMVVRHKCDTPLCINPAHLELGTTADNVADKVARNRQAKGSQIGASRLTEAQIVEIRSSEMPAVELAEKLKVHPATVWRVRQGVIWKHV